MKVPNLTFSKRLTYNLESFHESGGVGGGIGGFSSLNQDLMKKICYIL